jgi:hypothetical protein
LVKFDRFVKPPLKQPRLNCSLRSIITLLFLCRLNYYELLILVASSKFVNANRHGVSILLVRVCLPNDNANLT